jgi:hypothetical protein
LVVTLGLVVGNRLSDEALGVLAGAVCGVGAAIPTTLIVVAVTRRRKARGDTDRRYDGPPWRGAMELEDRRHTARQHGYPPVIVVSPQGGPFWSGGWDSHSHQPSSLRAPLERKFTVVGGASDSVAAGRHRDSGYSSGA